MTAEILCPKLMSVLAVLPRAESCGPAVLSVLKGHYTLFCPSARCALESAPDFAPDVILIDSDLPDRDDLVDGLSEVLASEPIFVAVSSRGSGGELPTGFHYQLTVPIAASELDQILGHIGHGNETELALTPSSRH